MEVVIKKYEHFNTSFKKWNTPKGRYIRNKDDYDRAMKEEGMITSEEAVERVKPLKDYKLSGEAESIIREARDKIRSGGLKLSDGVTQKMIDKKIIKPKGYGLEHLPSHLQRSL
jgi:hypothetical protein